MLVDSHCHLNFKDFDQDLEQVIANAAANGILYMQTISTKITEFDQVLRIAKQHQNIYASVGIHPNEVENQPQTSAEKLLYYTKDPKIIGIGETGLDYYYKNSEVDLQKKSFIEHIQCARAAKLPLIVHTRNAEKDTANILKAHMKNEKGLLHCFTSDISLAKVALDLGFYISFSGIVTFKNASTVQEVARYTPIDRMLIETDAPYLAPVPKRGHRNEPAFVLYTAKFIANLKKMEFEEFAQATTKNFFELFSKTSLA
jgi:TatD DNase family protein